MPEYVVETYLARGEDFLAAAALADATTAHDAQVVHVRSTFFDEDEICLHWFRAPSADAVRVAAAQARLECDRVVTAETIDKEGRR